MVNKEDLKMNEVKTEKSLLDKVIDNGKIVLALAVGFGLGVKYGSRRWIIIDKKTF